MAKRPSFEIRVAPPARCDVAAALIWNRREFGDDAAQRYSALFAQAFQDLAEDPYPPGARKRPELGRSLMVYHLASSRERARSTLGLVRKPRHMVIYREIGGVIEVIRVVRDARDIERVIAKEQR